MTSCVGHGLIYYPRYYQEKESPLAQLAEEYGQLGISGKKKKEKREGGDLTMVIPKQLLLETTVTLGVQETNVWRLHYLSLKNVLQNMVCTAFGVLCSHLGAGTKELRVWTLLK